MSNPEKRARTDARAEQDRFDEAMKAIDEIESATPEELLKSLDEALADDEAWSAEAGDGGGKPASEKRSE